MEVFYENIRTVLDSARQNAYRAINFAMVEAYWQIGQLIVEEEQQGNSKAEYGSGLLKYLAQRLTTDFGKGFDEREVRRIRQFYSTFPIRDAVRPELSWTHYRLLLKVENPDAQAWYIAETAQQHLNGSQQLFASKYRLYLPTEEELMAEIERDKLLLAENRQTE